MLFSFKRAIAIVALGTFCSLAGLAQENKGPQWKDRAEYDLVDSIQKEQTAKTKLGLLNSWKEKYPASEFKELRHNLYVQTYQGLGDGKGMKQAAKDWVADNPKAFLALYWLNLLTISLNDNSAPALEDGVKAGEGMLAVLDETFDPSKKQANITDEAWRAEKQKAEALARRTLGWVAMQKNNNEEAEKQLTAVLKLNTNDAMASYWLGTVIAKQRKLEKQSAALYHFAHAATHEGQEALPPEQRKQILAYLEKTYINFHGDKGGLPEMIALTKNNPIPPDDFKIKSKQEILEDQEKELMTTNPMLALWVRMKGALSGAGGAEYFAQIKGSGVPGGVEVGTTKVEKFKGKVVSSNPPAKPKEVVVGISAPDMSEVTLRFEKPLTAPVPAGTELEFSGVPVEFTPDPFMLTFDTDPADVAGLPKAAPPAKKAPAGAKKGAGKKK